MHRAPDHFGQWASLANVLPLLHSNGSTDEQEPRSWKEVMKSQHADEWKKASQVEYDSLMKHKVWVASVIRWESVHMLIATAIQKGMKLHQMDIKMVFLNGYLEEEVYMCQPEGFKKSGKEHLICRLKRLLYGLKQLPRCWNQILHEKLE